MLRSPQLLLVFPVPFAALDASGMPAAAVRFDPPTGRRNEVHFIGCTRQNTLVERRKRAEGRQSVYATSFRYDLAPQRITHTDYHVQRIRHGELIAADAATAKIAGVPFVAPATAFECARSAAIQRWEQEYSAPPPVDRWPDLRLVLPEDDTPSTMPAHGASLRAKRAPPAVEPVAAPTLAVPAAEPVPIGTPAPAGKPPAAPLGEAPRAAPGPVPAGTPFPHAAAEEHAPAANTGAANTGGEEPPHAPAAGGEPA